MSSPPSRAAAPLRPLPWEGLAPDGLQPLDAEECRLRVARASGISVEALEVGEHPRSGRNRIFRVRARDGRAWLAKQADGFSGAEAHFYDGPGRSLGFVLRPLVVDAPRRLVILPEASGSTGAQDPETLLAGLAPVLARLHRWTGEPDRDALGSAGSPFPALDPVDVRIWEDSSPAARSLIRRVQASEALGRAVSAPAAGAGTPALIHGDLKPDNVLFTDRGVRLLDWECAGWGPAEWDVAAPVASLLLDSADGVARLLDGTAPDTTPGEAGLEREAHPSPARVLTACGSMLSAYRDAGGPELDIHVLALFIAAWMVGRSWVHASFEPLRVHPALEIRLLLAEDLLARPEQLVDPP